MANLEIGLAYSNHPDLAFLKSTREPREDGNKKLERQSNIILKSFLSRISFDAVTFAANPKYSFTKP